MIREEAFGKLGLIHEEHPTPYKLTWLKMGSKIRVTHRCLVSLSIGAFYKDKFYCDIMPMDISHILLGRPWQYDMNVIHDGCHNTRSFVFDNRRIVLFPTATRTALEKLSTELQSSIRAPTLLCSRSKFENEFQELGCAWLLVPGS